MEEDGGESRDWAEMQSDALSAVFRKLDAVDFLTGAGLVCRPWRRLADSDTTLWRRVDMTRHGDVREADAMARAAVDRAAGTLEAFSADTFVTDGLLRYISHRAFSLKSLQLSLCHHISNEGLALSAFLSLKSWISHSAHCMEIYATQLAKPAHN